MDKRTNFKYYLKQILSPFWIFLGAAIKEYWYDLMRYYHHSATAMVNNRSKLTGKIIARYHVIEKGLVMPEPRLGFGKEVIEVLINDSIEYIKKYGQSDEQLQHAIAVIFEYIEFNQKNGYQLEKTTLQRVDELKAHIKIEMNRCAQRKITDNEFFKHSESPFPVFSNSRSSVRNYAEEDIPIDLLYKAMDLVRNTPSACNRQSVRVYIYSNKKEIKKILSAQGGNRGFGELANKLIVITSELGNYSFLSERNLLFIDGGIYAMNLLYALHYYKIAACILNCSFTKNKEQLMRRLTKIKDSETFVVMISCGFAPKEFKIPISKRYTLENIVNVINT
ncbi:MAG: nitroreductase family protein [candidate division KSB1 bacterium]|nr:nitroreductase family protein [candidate division KSB1 bacterium]